MDKIDLMEVPLVHPPDLCLSFFLVCVSQILALLFRVTGLLATGGKEKRHYFPQILQNVCRIQPNKYTENSKMFLKFEHVAVLWTNSMPL